MPEPSTLAGYVDVSALSQDMFGAAMDIVLEHNPDLQHPQSVRTFAKMRHDPQIAAVLRAYYLAITRASWSIDPSGCRDEVAQRIADDLGLPILDANETPAGARRRGFTWAEHLRLALGLSTTFGFAPFAQQWADEDGSWRLKVVQERMPQTITALHLNGDGTLKSAEQGGLGTTPVQMRTANHELVWYAREREGSNYFGRSLIREAYAPWLMKTDALRRHATAVKRFSMGIPEVQAPPGATPQQVAEAQRYAQSIQASDRAGVGLPAGFVSSWKGMTGTVPNALEFVTMLDRYITRTTLTSILDMATAEKGNRSLGDTVMQLMQYAQQAEGNRLAEDGTQQIVIPLVDANWGENEAAPRIVCGDVTAKAQLTADEQANLLHYGGLQADKPYRAWLRKTNNIPAEDPDYVPPAKTSTGALTDA